VGTQARTLCADAEERIKIAEACTRVTDTVAISTILFDNDDKDILGAIAFR